MLQGLFINPEALVKLKSNVAVLGSVEKEKRMTTDIVIIDSGINHKHPALSNEKIHGINLLNKENANEIEDEIGHGTAVYYLVRRFAANANILPIKIFSDEFSTAYDMLYLALEYVYENIDCKILHLSNGVTYCDEIDCLRTLCRKIREKGIIIVSAFDNGGAISYPAAFPEVIGVDWSLSCRRFSDYEFVDNSIVNIRGIGTELRVPWLKEDYILVGGSSFVAPYITSCVYKLMKKNVIDLNEILTELRSHAKKIISYQEDGKLKESFSIKKAVIFPYNKEIHSLLRYSDLLSFEIEKICDNVYMGNVGKRINELTKNQIESDLEICDLDQIDWSNLDFDTFVLGHTKEISDVVHRDFISEVLQLCIKYKKNIYCFDNLLPYEELCNQIQLSGCSVFYPCVDENAIPKSNMGKLYHIGKPVIGVFGTSSKQGKYTLQLALRQRFLRDGYQVGQLGTEPSAYLFGLDACYPMGYASTVETTGLNAISTINYMMSKIEQKDPDIIIVGGQSQTIPLSTGNLGLYTLYNQELLLGSEPDICIICVNTLDDISYVKRTIEYLESWIDTKVIAMVLYPLERNLRWSVMGNYTSFISEEELEKKKNELSEEFQRSVFILNRPEEIEELYQQCINYFTE